MTDLLLKGGLIIDGSGSPPRAADVRIRAGRIAEVGADLPPDREEVLDVDGAYVAPGFIDLHTHYDGSLYWDPACDPIMLHGVTTVLIGNCSLGLAPLRRQDRAMLSSLFSYIEDVPAAVFDDTVPWTWESFEEYAEELRSRSFGPNIIVLVSHSLLRQFVMGADAWRRASTAAESDEIAQLLDRALKAGAVGISSSRFDRSPAGEPVPSFYADDEELGRLFTVLGAHGAVFQFIGRVPLVEEFIEDIMRVGAHSVRHNVPILSNAMYQRPENPEAHHRLQEAADEIKAMGGSFHHLVSPRPIELPLRFHESFAMNSVVAWNELIATPVDRKATLASDPAWRERARCDWHAAVFSKRLDGMRIVEVGKAELSDWIGRSLADLVAERGGDSSDVLADWIIENGFETSFVFPVSNLDLDAVADMLVAGDNLISGSDAGAHYKMFCGAGDTSLILQRHVRERTDLALEDAVKRMTSDQARVMGLIDRGTIETGAVADLTVFRLDEVQWQREYLVKDVPGGNERLTRPPGGFLYTIVAGRITQCGGTHSGLLPGQLIERAAAMPAIAQG